MPFTPSHAVVALPFVGTRLVPAAVAIGAMTPDVPLFVRGTPVTYAGTHDLRWIPLTMVLALMLLVVWRVVLRPAVRELSPRWLAARLPVTWERGPRAALRETFPSSLGGTVLLLVSLLVGVASHIVWDSFTHEGRVGTAVLPALGMRWGSLAGYTWLQHGSSVAGLLVVAVWSVLWLRRRRTIDEPVPRALPDAVRVAWWLSLPVILIVAWVTGLAILGPLSAEFTPAHLAYRVLPPACAVWAALTVVLCVVAQAARRRSRPDGTGHRGDTPGMRR
jgi:hypothetical protein